MEKSTCYLRFYTNYNKKKNRLNKNSKDEMVIKQDQYNWKR